MPLAVRRLALPLLGAIIAVSCLAVAEPNRVDIPAGAIVYRIAPQLLTAEYIDTTAGRHFELTWLTSLGLSGYNCFGFSPTTPTDTTGSFVFGHAGPNSGRIERRNNGVVTDTVTGSFLADPPPGTHGSYVVDSSGKLTLNWADGARNLYFAPSAVIRLYGDTVESVADLRTAADSIRDQWHVYWVFSPSCS